MIKSLLFAVPLVLAAAPALAQNSDVDPARLAAARELVDVTDMRSELSANMQKTIASQLDAQLGSKQVPPELVQEFRAIAQDEFQSYMNAAFPKIVDQSARIYARHFTTEEIKHLTGLQRDPVMVKFRSQMGTIMGELMPTIIEAQKPMQERMVERMMAAATAYTAKHPESRAKK